MTLQERILKNWPEMFPHSWYHKTGRHNSSPCDKCGKRLTYKEYMQSPSDPCTVPDPIEIDWNLVMKLFRDTVEADMVVAGTGLGIAMAEAYNKSHGYTPKAHEVHAPTVGAWVWFVLHATPEDYALAACMAKEKEKDNE